MFIISQDGKSVINLSQANSVFTNSQNRVCAAFSNSTGCQLGEYEYPYGKTAIKMLTVAIKAGVEVFQMPSNETLKVSVEQAESHGHREQHAANGAVIKRNGGS